jgi:hypothetical protein
MKTVVQKTLPGDVPFPWSEKDPYRLPVSIDRVQKMLITLGVWRCVVCADVLGGGVLKGGGAAAAAAAAAAGAACVLCVLCARWAVT